MHPTQVYETLAAAVIWGIGIWLVRRGARPGTVALVTLALLAVERAIPQLPSANAPAKPSTPIQKMRQ